MRHDYNIVFDIENPYWQRVLEIFKNNEHYEKKRVSGRNLHHKFPRSFSKIIGEPIDNDKDNLISLSLTDHFLVHYYYYLLARKGFKQSMAVAYTCMAKKGLKFISPETAEAMAKDYEEAKTIAQQKLSEAMKGEKNHFYGKHHTDETCKKISEANKGRRFTAETRRKIGESHKGLKYSEESRRKISEAKKGKEPWNKGRHLSEKTCIKMSEAKKGRPPTKGCKGMHWYNNGVENILTYTCPDGYIKGRLK